MVAPIYIDISPLVRKFNISKDDRTAFVTSLLNSVVQEIESEWKQESNVLGSTRAEYQKAIYVQNIDYKSSYIGLAGRLPNMIELGASAFDMKVGFEKSSKKVLTFSVDKKGDTKEGWYLTIPFRHAAPSSLGESTAFANKLPKPIHKIAKNLEVGESITKAMLPPNYADVVGSRPTVVTQEQVYETYTHKSSIYEGVQKSNKPRHSGYVSFRRVSDNSDPNSWIHTGLQPRNFLEKAVSGADLESVKRMEIDNFIESMGFSV